MRFELVNDLHRANFWSTRYRPRRQTGHQSIKRIAVIAKLTRHRRRDMHHVAIAFHDHDVGKLNGTVLCDSANIVATEIDQHHMFGTFLFICQQFFFESFIFFRRRATFARPGQRPDGNFSIDDTAHDLWGTTHQRTFFAAQKKHERARIEHSQAAINFQGIAFDVQSKTLAEHDLKDVSGMNVFNTILDSFPERFASHIGSVLRRIAAGRSNIHVTEFVSSLRCLQSCNQFTDSSFGVFEGRLWRIEIVQPRQCHHKNCFCNMIENQHRVIKRKTHIVELPIVFGGVRQFFDVADHVVASKSDRTSSKRWQVLQDRDVN